MCLKHPMFKEVLKLKLDIGGQSEKNKFLKIIETWIHKSGIASKLVYNEDVINSLL